MEGSQGKLADTTFYITMLPDLEAAREKVGPDLDLEGGGGAELSPPLWQPRPDVVHC